MRRTFVAMCELCSPASLDARQLIQAKPRGESITFLCPEHDIIFHYDLAWLGHTPYINRTGALLSDFVEPGARGSDVHEPAMITLVSAGSHSPRPSVGKLHALVPDFLELYHNLTQGRNGRSGLMVTMLTPAVCIEKIPEHHQRKYGTWEMLMRNNYRVFALNEIIYETSRRLDTAIVDLFSWSLSIGCDRFSDAVHMNMPVYSEFARVIANTWFPRMLG